MDQQAIKGSTRDRVSHEEKRGGTKVMEGGTAKI